MAAERIPILTPEQYLEIEREAEFKSEYVAGQMYLMAGGTPEHSQIAFNIAGALRHKLRGGPCRGYTSDLRVRAGSLFTYPDVTVVCGEPRFHDDREDTIINPKLIIEVLSESTEAYDRGEKFGRYQRIDSLSEYVLVSQRRPSIDRYLRKPDGSWNLFVAEGLDASVELESISCSLDLADVYDDVELETTDTETALPRRPQDLKEG